MRLLADENVPLASVDHLAAAGHDIYSVARSAGGSPDESVLTRTTTERRVPLTFDRDFGELIYRRSVIGEPGVVFFRLVPRSPLEPAELLLAALAMPDLRLDGFFTVLDRYHIRQRPLPSSRTDGQ